MAPSYPGCRTSPRNRNRAATATATIPRDVPPHLHHRRHPVPGVIVPGRVRPDGVPDVLLLILVGIVLGPSVLGLASPADFGKVGPVMSTVAPIVVLLLGGAGTRPRRARHGPAAHAAPHADDVCRDLRAGRRGSWRRPLTRPCRGSSRSRWPRFSAAPPRPSSSRSLRTLKLPAYPVHHPDARVGADRRVTIVLATSLMGCGSRCRAEAFSVVRPGGRAAVVDDHGIAAGDRCRPRLAGGPADRAEEFGGVRDGDHRPSRCWCSGSRTAWGSTAGVKRAGVRPDPQQLDAAWGLHRIPGLSESDVWPAEAPAI